MRKLNPSKEKAAATEGPVATDPSAAVDQVVPVAETADAADLNN
jgi:hypothetical protein